MFGKLALLIIPALLAGCQKSGPDPEAQPRIIGLSQADGATFTRSPDGGALSLLYDTFIVRGQKASSRKRYEQSRGFTIVSSAPIAIKVDIRGAHLGDPAGLGELILIADGKPQKLNLVGADKVEWHLALSLKPVTPVTLTARFSSPQPQDAEIHIDSIDIALATK